MKVGLQPVILDSTKDDSVSRHFRFAVVDLERIKGYPLNFVCTLPLCVDPNVDKNVFTKIFGETSLKVAKELLYVAWQKETNTEVKVELTRRLKLLEPKAISKIQCYGCRKLFQPQRTRGFKQNLCQECTKKRFGSRD